MNPTPGRPAVYIRKRRPLTRRPKGLRAVPKRVWAILAACLAVIIAIPILGQQAWKWRNPPDSGAAADSTAAGYASTDRLSISGAKFAADCRCIRGKITNNSARAFRDVQVYYRIHGPNNLDLGAILALPGQMGPRSSTTFATDSLPKEYVRWELQEIQAAK